MLERVLISLTLALMGLSASAGISEAASDKTDVMVGTGATVLVLMAVLLVVYLVKHAAGLDRMPPAPPVDDHAGGHH